MRITNKMMTNTSLNNINTNKLLVDQLNTQLATRQKIVLPSDDPVVAIRALRLRSNLNEINQYYERNIPDAEAWLEITEAALKQAEDMIGKMMSEFTRGATGEFKDIDRKAMLSNISGYMKEFYNLGNSDYDGRTVFTGYRTETQLTFLKDTQADYVINEKFSADDIDIKTYISGKVKIDKTNIGGSNIIENDVQENPVYRVRLAYDNISSTPAPNVSIGGNPFVVTTKSLAAGEDGAYLNVPDDEVYYIPETGELILGKDAQNALKQPGGQMEVNYPKSDWKQGDLRPEMYFDCVDNTDPQKPINYQYSNQYTEYDIGFKQSLRINTLASDMFGHDVGREVNEITEALNDSLRADEKVAEIKAMMEDPANEPHMEKLEYMLAAAEKEKTLTYEKGQAMMESALTKSKKWQSKVSAEVTDLGNRDSRLQLVQARLKEQTTSFTNLAQENDGVDMTSKAVELKSAQLAYDSALLAVGQIAQTSLLNYL